MYNSPATPVGTGRFSSSSTNTRVFAIGRPIVIGSSTDRIRAQVDQTVVSVGPYMFHRLAPRWRRRAASSRSSGSPPHSILSTARPRQPAASSMRQVAGVACISVAAAASIDAPSA